MGDEMKMNMCRQALYMELTGKTWKGTAQGGRGCGGRFLELCQF